MDTILIASQDPQTNTAISKIVSPDDQIHLADSSDQVLETIQSTTCDCLFIELSMMEALHGSLGGSTDSKTPT